jgi:hypothetical protein
MAYNGGATQVNAFIGNSSDAFGRGRTAHPETLFNVSFEYDAQPLLMQTVVNGSATATKTAGQSSVTLSTVDGTTAHGVDFQSKPYMRYEPGKSLLIAQTGIIGAAKANVRSQIGYYDANNGVFFDQNNGIAVTVRTNTSGSPVDSTVAQASWNLDKMDGSGASGVTIDFTKGQIFIIDLQWLGSGRVRFGFDVQGIITYCHQVNNANLIILPYMNTACLPLHWAIHNTGAASGATTLQANCGTVIAEGGNDSPAALTFGVGNAALVASISTTRTALLTIRPKTTFNSITNRSKISVLEVDLYNNDGTTGGYWELVYNGTLGGSPSYNSADANSGVEFDVAGTTCTGGTVIAAGVCQPAHSSTTQVLLSKLPITLDAAGSIQDLLTLCLRAYSSSISGATGAFRWKEER